MTQALPSIFHVAFEPLAGVLLAPMSPLTPVTPFEADWVSLSLRISLDLH